MAQTTVYRRLGPCVLMVVAVSHRRRGSRTVKLPSNKNHVSKFTKKRKKKEKPMGQTTVNRRLGPRMLMVVAVGCRRRMFLMGWRWAGDGIRRIDEDEELTIYVINNVT